MRPRRLAPVHVLPLAGAAVFVACAASLFGGAPLVLALPVLVAWAFYNVGVMVRSPGQRRLRAVNLGIWAVALAAAVAVHVWRWHTARQQADAIVSAIDAFHAQHGRYPEKLADVGYADGPRTPGRVLYVLDGSRPGLVYPSTFAPFDAYIYDFEHARWQYRPD